MYETLLGASVPFVLAYLPNFILNSIWIQTSKFNFIIKNAPIPLEEEPSVLFSSLEKMNNSSLHLCGAATTNQNQYRTVPAHIEHIRKGRHAAGREVQLFNSSVIQ